MTTSSMSLFFALLTLACWAATTITVGVVVIAPRARPDSIVVEVRDGIQDAALWLAWIVAAVATLGSLYYSLVAHYLPCELCWYQRICIYPLSGVLLIAALRRDSGIWRYALPQVIVGIAISAYHTQLQAFPEQHTFCQLSNPCTVRYVWEFGFVSLPFMALAAGSFILTMLLVTRTAPTRNVVPHP